MKPIILCIIAVLASACSSSKIRYCRQDDGAAHIILGRNKNEHVVYTFFRSAEAVLSPNEKYLAITDYECSNSSKIVIVSLENFKPIELSLGATFIPQYADHIYFEFKKWVTDDEFAYSVRAYDGLGHSVEQENRYSINK
jgi:hypothetical protein